MTPEQARNAGEVMLAYADRKEIQWHDHDDPPDDWSLCSPKAGDKLAFDWACFDYCIKPESKPESKVVKFDVHTVPRDAWLRRADCDPKEGAFRIVEFCHGHIHVGRGGNDGHDKYTYEDALEKFVFVDTGEPFGRVEDGE